GAIAHRRELWEFGAAQLKVARVWECTGEAGEGSFAQTGDRSLFDKEIYKVRSVKTTDAKPMMRMLSRNQHLRPRVFATGVPNFHHYAVEGPGRRVYGYFSMAVTDGEGPPPVFIPEVEVENREAAETILAHAAPFAQMKGMRALHFALAAEHPFANVCLDLGGYFQLRGTTRDITLDEEMIRVIDVRGCLEALEPELADRLSQSGHLTLDQELTLDVEGEKVPLRLSEGSLKPVDSVDASTRVRLPRWFFTQLLMGYRSPSDTKRHRIRPAAMAELFSAVFPKTWPLSLCDHDLWDPSLRDPSKYCDSAMEEIRKLRYPF
ncbi:MAG: GNAT family N-acetyltransferase, partial [Planctomycetota bacterium]